MKEYVSMEISKNSFSKFLGKVFGIMFLGVLITTATAYFLVTNVNGIRFVLSIYSGYGYWLVFILQLALVFGLRYAISSKNTLLSWTLFIAYALTISLTFTIIGLMFSSVTIYKAFISATVLFASLAIIGLTTKVNLAKFSNLLFVGLFALIIASLLNVFLFRSDSFDLLISFVGLAIFLGLTMFDTQKLKYMYQEGQYDSKALANYAVLGAFELYLDFVNIFLYLLQLFSRND